MECCIFRHQSLLYTPQVKTVLKKKHLWIIIFRHIAIGDLRANSLVWSFERVFGRGSRDFRSTRDENRTYAVKILVRDSPHPHPPKKTTTTSEAAPRLRIGRVRAFVIFLQVQRRKKKQTTVRRLKIGLFSFWETNIKSWKFTYTTCASHLDCNPTLTD